MKPGDAPRPVSLVFTLVKIAAGLIFFAIWETAAAVWATMSTVANLMANDSGRATIIDHGMLIAASSLGQIVVAAAGLPGALAFFWTGMRRFLLWSFAILCVGGAAIQIWAFRSFASAMGW